MRLIDAEELGEKIEEEFDGICAYDVSPDEAVNDFQDIVDSCKTVDATPVVHGHWIKVKGTVGWYESCSICGSGAERQGYNFCPRCGAKMGSEVNDNVRP